ncbi:hypothetical protein G7047_28485 [Diaphorobacter sp. HDW4A]|uniref:hypothetical protein n=1 Tax=Diaphorobacter sp. HDW4A TaxID=2714924 RepID=UPI00140A8AA9|nr:hypothetical protein [Diaphorobacter sp. HDW4A]QIL83446.1 hypothetical protein G7047_28485 [Diaphorobacter sp. HDW4A]
MNDQNNQQSNGQVETAIEVQRFPEHFKAIVQGRVQHRVGDGPLEEMPVGTEVQVDTALASYVLSWNQPGDGHSEIVTLAKREFELYVDNGDLKVVE